AAQQGERGVHLPDAVPLRQVTRQRKQQKRYRLALIGNAGKVLWFPANQIRTCRKRPRLSARAGSATRARREGIEYRWFLLRCVRPLMAQSGHAEMSTVCPLSAAKMG